MYCSLECAEDANLNLEFVEIKMKTQKIIAYATNQNGDGYVTKIGEYENWEDIEIRVGFYHPDVLITFEVEDETKEN